MFTKFSTKEYLRSQGVPESLIEGLKEFRRVNRLEEAELNSEVLKGRIPQPQNVYIGGRVLSMAVSALLEGKHLILEGEKSSGKNVLANTLAFMFQRPTWTSSCHVQVDESKLVGSETFRNNEVTFREGHVVRAMRNGGFFIADEVNFSRPEAVSVLYSATDFRGEVDVSGYEKVIGHPAYRVVATMNYGYSGTRELNEAFADRFVVIHCGGMEEEELKAFLLSQFPDIDDYYLGIFVGIYMDLQKKAENSEISSRAISLRGLLDALACMKRGLKPLWALEIGLVNKAFDPYERMVVSDTVKTRVPEKWEAAEVFGGEGTNKDSDASSK